jgi:leucyl aminopeptidase
MSDPLLQAADSAVPIATVAEAELVASLETLGGQAAGLAEAEGFKAKAGQTLKLPGADGKLARVLLGLGAEPKADIFRTAAGRLPAGDYRLDGVPEGLDPTAIATAWGVGAYRNDR